MVLPSGQDELLTRAGGLAASGRRVLVLARAHGPLHGQALPPGLRAMAFLVLAERLRSDAPDTIAYFAAQGVAVKVISGDSPHTVSAVAARAGVPAAREIRSTPGACRTMLARWASCWRNAR